MLRPSFLLTAALCAVLNACATGPFPGSASATTHASGLHRTDTHTVLDRPLQDFYDTAFVLTNGGVTAPRVLTPRQLADALAPYDVVFFGENHTHAGIHLAQMQLLRALVEREPRRILSFEQFERDTQGVIDDYLAGRIGENTLIDKARAWNNYTSAYRPLMLFARNHHLPVVAAEAPGWTITCVGKFGLTILDRFTPAERADVAADIHVTPGAYRDKFLAFMGGSTAHGTDAAPPTAGGQVERSFAAQATRDDTMAESIERALHVHPGYAVLQVNGSFHSAGFLGTVERLRLRDPTLKIAVIDPVEVTNPAAPAYAAQEAADATALALIYPTPDDFVDGEDTSAWMSKMTHEHESSRCKYAP